MSATRRVELSSRAEQALRALPTAERQTVARGIDRLTTSGLPAAGHHAEADVRVGEAGDYLLLCIERDAAIVVVAIEPIEEHPGRTVRRAARAPLLPASRSRLGRALADLWMDVRVGLRVFAQQPTFVLVTVLTLALGIGGNVAVFGVFSNVFLGELPLRDADRLVRLRNYSTAANGEVRAYNMSPRDFLQIREHAGTLEDVVGVLGHSFTIAGESDPERVAGVFVSEQMPRILGIEPIYGTPFSAEQEALGVDAGVVLIGHAFWRRRFGDNPEVVGETLLLDGRPHVISGIMPPSFQFPYDAQLWVPMRFPPDDGRSHSLNVLAHTRPGIDLGTAREELDGLARRLAAEFPDTNRDIGIQARPARDSFIDDEDDAVQALFAAVGFLLLITCVNLTNALIARYSARRHEIGVRAALGAGRFRQMRQFLTETALLFAAGGAGGLLLALWMSDYLVILIPNVLRDQLALGAVRFDAGMIGFAFAVTLVAALACGAVAALRAVGADLHQSLREGGRASGSAARRRVQQGLVVAEVSLALVLLVGAGIMLQHFMAVRAEQLGFDAHNLLTVRIDLAGTVYETPEQRSNLVRAIEQSIGAVPGVASAGLTTVNPICCGDWGAAVEFEGREPPSDGSRLLVSHRYVTPDFFRTMTIPLRRGRAFTDVDDARSEPVVIIDQRLADHHFPGTDSLGQRIRLGGRPDAPWRTIIGVAANIKDMSDYEDGWYLPFHQDAAARGTDPLHFMVRLQGDPEQLVDVIHAAVWDVAPGLAVYDTRMMAEVSDELVADDRLAATVTVIFALLGTALAGFGVYGLMAFFVGQRRVEIGTRLALGARPGDVLMMVMRQALWLALGGIGVGVVASAALTRVASYFIENTGSGSIPLVAGVATLLAACTMLATWLPARRAARVDPLVALRSGE